jgi:SAM-dependent methyltransferase
VSDMSQTPESSSNSAQIDYWNAGAGQTWAQFQEQLDRQLEPLGLEAVRTLMPSQGERILDIGCGCGQTSLELAARVGPEGLVVGVDISKPMLEVALHRPLPASNLHVDFRYLDAQADDLGQGVFDAAFSRFGVMFFSDPVAAFANIRASLKPGGRLAFVCWRPLQENLWMRAPLEAALPFLPPVPPSDPTAPGPFAFADASRLRSILIDAGFGSIAIEPFDASVGGAGIAPTLQLTFRVGPLGAMLREHPECAEAVAGAVGDVLAKYATPNGVLMPAAVWIALAKNS